MADVESAKCNECDRDCVKVCGALCGIKYAWRNLRAKTPSSPFLHSSIERNPTRLLWSQQNPDNEINYLWMRVKRLARRQPDNNRTIGFQSIGFHSFLIRFCMERYCVSVQRRDSTKQNMIFFFLQSDAFTLLVQIISSDKIWKLIITIIVILYHSVIKKAVRNR
jgi:hypothetical protein